MTQKISSRHSADNIAVHQKIRSRLLPILMSSYLVNYLDRSNIGFAKLSFLHDLHMSEAQYGFGAGLFYLGYSALEIPSNLLLAKIGARISLFRIMVLWGICAALFSLILHPGTTTRCALYWASRKLAFFPACCSIFRIGYRKAAARRLLACLWRRQLFRVRWVPHCPGLY